MLVGCGLRGDLAAGVRASVMSLDPWMDRAVARRALAEMELLAKGYRIQHISAGLDRAWGTAEYRTAEVRPELKAQAFYDTLVGELPLVEKWVRQLTGSPVDALM